MVPLLPILLLLPLLASASSLVLYPDSTTLPFAVHVPDTAQPPYPAILFLSGNGSLGDVADLGTLTMWDGVGLMISLYLSGNTTAAPQAAGEDWLTILPLGPVGMVNWDPNEVLEVLAAASKNYSVDTNRTIVSGYSIGGIGAWNTALASPSSFAALVPSAGLTDYITSAQLSTLLSPSPVSIYAFAGTNDTKQPLAGISATITEILALPGAGNANITFEAIEGDHSTMTSVPFEEAGLWTWMANQRKTTVAAVVVSTSSASSGTLSGESTGKSVGGEATGGSRVSSEATGAVPTSSAKSSGARRARGILW